MRTKSLLLLLSGLAGIGTANAANLIINGGFENQVLSVGGSSVLASGDTTTLPGWTATGATCGSNCTYVLSTAYSDNSIGFSSQEGNQAMDMTGGYNTLDGGLFQSVATDAGEKYLLSFYVGNQDDAVLAYSLASSLELLIDGTSQGLFTNSDSSSGNVNWKHFAFSFTAASSTSTIEFRNATSAGDNYAGLDNVSMDVDAPEPATMLLCGVALLALAASKRRV